MNTEAIYQTQKITQTRFTIHTQSFVRAQQVYHAALICSFGSPQIHIDHNFQWELDKNVDSYRVTFFASNDLTYTDVSKSLAGCMRELRN